MPDTYSDNPAFPTDNQAHKEKGLTKREYFAAKALQGILSGPKPEGMPDVMRNEKQLDCAKAVSYAEALIEELNQ